MLDLRTPFNFRFKFRFQNFTLEPVGATLIRVAYSHIGLYLAVLQTLMVGKGGLSPLASQTFLGKGLCFLRGLTLLLLLN